MKLNARDANRFFAKPDATKSGLLMYGPDSTRVVLKRQEVVAAIVGPSGDEEMRLTRIDAAELRKDAAMLSDAIKAQSFFPGPRVVLLENAGDGLSKVIAPALADWQSGDAFVVVTAGSLTTKSSLRRLFERDANTVAAGIYDDPPSHAEIRAHLEKMGIGVLSADADSALLTLARETGPGDFRQTLEKLSLYKRGDDEPVSGADVAVCAPQTTLSQLDDALNMIAESRVADIGAIMRKLAAQGVNPTTLCIGATRHFRSLHMAATHAGGPDEALSKARPPVFGPRKDRLVRQARSWGGRKLESALEVLIDTDLQLRSASAAPAQALLERAFIRISMLGKRRV